MYVKASGQPFIGSISMVPAALGPTPIPVKSIAGGAVYTLAANERLIITNITISSNDTALPLITLDDGATTPRIIGKYYTGSTLPAIQECMPPGVTQGFLGTLPRATASAITTAKTVEIVIRGYIAQTV